MAPLRPTPGTRPSSYAFCAVSARCRLPPKKLPLRHPRRPQLFIYFQTRGRPSPFNLKLEKPPAVSFLNGRVLSLPLCTLAPASLPRSPTSNHPLPRPPRPPPLTARLDVGLALS